MDHRYIDQRSVAERYLDRTLPAPERAAFEAHLVDCQECTDRLLLAEMFHARNGVKPAKAPPANAPPARRRVRFIGSFSPRLFWMLAAAAGVLAVATAAGLVWLLLVPR